MIISPPTIVRKRTSAIGFVAAQTQGSPSVYSEVGEVTLVEYSPSAPPYKAFLLGRRYRSDSTAQRMLFAIRGAGDEPLDLTNSTVTIVLLDSEGEPILPATPMTIVQAKNGTVTVETANIAGMAAAGQDFRLEHLRATVTRDTGMVVQVPTVGGMIVGANETLPQGVATGSFGVKSAY